MTKRDRSEWSRNYYRRPEVVERVRAYARAYSKTPRMRQYVTRKRNERRDFIFRVLGEICVRCGFADRRALQMDHVHGRNGEKRLGNIDARYKFVRDFPEEAKKKYQILCANCNFIKMEENFEYAYHKNK